MVSNNLFNKFVNAEKSTFNKFTETVAVSSIVLGTVALLLSLSILEGFDTKLRDFSMKFAAHISINTVDNSFFNFNDNKIKSLQSILPDSSIIIQGLSSEALAKSSKQITSISIRGLDEKSYDFIKGFIISDNFKLENLNKDGLLISKTLADQLNLRINDELIIFSPKIAYGDLNDFKVSKLRINGIYHSGMTQYDQVLAYSTYSSVARIADKELNDANSIHIYLKNPYIAAHYINKIEEHLDYPFFAYTIFDMNQQIFSWIELQKEPIPIILASITIVATLNIITTLLVLILEKVKSIGILRAIGISKFKLLKMMTLKGLRISLIGSFVGSLLSLIFIYIQSNFGIISLDGSIYYIDTLPVVFNVSQFVLVNSLSITFGTIIALLPAYISIRTEIIKAIKFN